YKLPRTWAYYPVAGCGESRKSGSEWEGWEVIPSSTPNSGVISGTPTTVGSFDVTVTVLDTTGHSVKDKFELRFRYRIATSSKAARYRKTSLALGSKI
ncbi:MAG: hypothetical protein GDA43_25385, partial [Hormoscilla sp. SP5CHS1]|nr:hypothetical protein [Hormoscilla sp. SP5CHS1]